MDKNLLIICNDFPDINNIFNKNIFIKDQIEYLKKYYNKVYIVVPLPFFFELIRKRKYKNYAFDNVKIFFVKYFNILPFYFIFSSIWEYLEYFQIINFIKKNQLNFNLIHCHNTWPTCVLGIKIKEKTHIPLVLTEHSSALYNKVISHKNKKILKIWEKCDAIIRVSPDIKKIEKFGIDKKKLYYIPNGYNEKKFYVINKKRCRDILKIPYNKKILISIGNLVKEKNHELLIYSIKELQKKFPDILCIIIGDGKRKTYLQKTINRLKLSNNIQLLGGKNQDEIKFWLNSSDILIHPSLRESFGIVQLEAMACGKPVVATYNGGSENIIISQDYGLLCESRDISDFTEVISKALEIEWNSSKIINYANNYNLKEITKRIYKIHMNLLNDANFSIK